jgi:hypothetical protein
VRALPAARLALAGIAILAAGCAALPPAPPEVQALKGVWQERRAAFPEVRALADVRVQKDSGRGLWPEFTAVFTHRAPDRTAIAGFTPLGAPLFTFEAVGERYTFRTPDREAASTGRLDRPVADPALRLLGDLGHLLDGVLGPETGSGPVRLGRDGRWVVRHAGETVRLATDRGRITAVSVRRDRGDPVDLAFSDFRDAGLPDRRLEVPHRIEAQLPALGARVEIAVSDWVLAASPRVH